ncbi:hypothetical protein ASG60_08425 [Methylobacterium sp. Leaf469]|uniref:hypothetical protein n=1 Tax=Methylobacterium sp. Leaf469 TaxID=1736387 RepID=UPI0007018217|nr:hypothetical protein [Methylobacterium sp. Leaf469]KQT93381.1 hypothetical protein ASG60_08425 [Methylobacterium sp. Leaf469]
MAKSASIRGTDKARREPKIDLSRLSEEQKATRIAFLDLAEIAFGKAWQTPVASALGRDKAQVAGWISGRRPVPVDVLAELPALALRWAASLEHRAEMLRLRWDPALAERRIQIETAAAEAGSPPEPPPAPRTPEEIVNYIVAELLLDVPMDSPSD